MNQPLLSVKRKLWRQDDEHAIMHDEKYKGVRDKVLMRDKYTCCHCGFKFHKFQEVHHLDDDHSNQDESNLKTICSLCHQVYHLGMTALRNSGFIAYIPQLRQTEINSICRTIFILMEKLEDSSDLFRQLNGLYSSFQERGSETLKKLFYHGDKKKLDISQPMAFAQYLSLCSEEEYEKRTSSLMGFVLVPTRSAFKDDQLAEYYLHFGAENNKIENCYEIYKSLLNGGNNL